MKINLDKVKSEYAKHAATRNVSSYALVSRETQKPWSPYLYTIGIQKPSTCRFVQLCCVCEDLIYGSCLRLHLVTHLHFYIQGECTTTLKWKQLLAITFLFPILCGRAGGAFCICLYIICGRW